MLIFVEAGNAWHDVNKFNPFDLKRSAGVGVRIFPAYDWYDGYRLGLRFRQGTCLRNTAAASSTSSWDKSSNLFNQNQNIMRKSLLIMFLLFAAGITANALNLP